ncbi:MAG: hypothetical protein ABFD50_09595 [Smithella sp.]
MIEFDQAMFFRAIPRPLFFLFVLFSLMMPSSGMADIAATQLSHLRIIYGKEQAMADGTVTLPLEIHFYNEERGKNLESLFNVTAGIASLPARGPSAKTTKPLVYRAIPVMKTGDKWMIQLSTGTPRNFAIRVQAKSTTNGKTKYYSAETNCSVFGRKLNAKAASKSEALPASWFSGLGISIDPPFYYWPQTEDPLTVTTRLGSRALSKATLTVLDKSFKSVQYLTDYAGQIVYVPPDDPALNRRSEKAAKQVFLMSVHSERDNLFVATRTLRLHRNRFSHRELNKGIAIFGTVTLFSGGTVIWMRRRRRQM